MMKTATRMIQPEPVLEPDNLDTTCEVVDFCGDADVNNDEDCDPNDTTGAGVGYLGNTAAPTCEVVDFCGRRDTGYWRGMRSRNYLRYRVPCRLTDELLYCGDGEEEGREECDLGALNGVAKSGCSALCEELPVCGDKVVEGEETCDDGNLQTMMAAARIARLKAAPILQL